MTLSSFEQQGPRVRNIRYTRPKQSPWELENLLSFQQQTCWFVPIGVVKIIVSTYSLLSSLPFTSLTFCYLVFWGTFVMSLWWLSFSNVLLVGFSGWWPNRVDTRTWSKLCLPKTLLSDMPIPHSACHSKTFHSASLTYSESSLSCQSPHWAGWDISAYRKAYVIEVGTSQFYHE